VCVTGYDRFPPSITRCDRASQIARSKDFAPILSFEWQERTKKYLGFFGRK